MQTSQVSETCEAYTQYDMLKIFVTQAVMRHLDDCQAALCQSKLGQTYFASEAKARATLMEGITKQEIFVAEDEAGTCLGFIWFIIDGAFHSFPYLHIIAVKEAFRGMGVGTQLLAFFEQTVFPKYAKVFLVVADFNPEARRLYERLGYTQVGAMPDLYKPGVVEYLMMKAR